MTEKELKSLIEMLIDEMRCYVKSDKKSYYYNADAYGDDDERTIRAMHWYCSSSQFLYHLENELNVEHEQI